MIPGLRLLAAVWPGVLVVEEEPPDETLPVAVDESPAPKTLARGARVVKVTDAAGIAVVFLWLVKDGEPAELIFNGTSFGVGYEESSVEEVTEGDETGYRFTLYRDDGWPAGAFSVGMEAVDFAGNKLTAPDVVEPDGPGGPPGGPGGGGGEA